MTIAVHVALENISPDDRAREAFEHLQRFLETVPCDERRERIEMRYSDTELVECGYCGRGEAYKGRCPKCGGYVMSIREIAAHRERILGGECG